MLTVYKKVEKTLENPSGIIEISNPEELDKPFLLCISAQDNNDKSIYGIIREGSQAARVYTTQEVAAGFKIDDMPVDFLGLRFVKDDTYNRNYEEIVDKFLYPFLVGDGTKSLDEIKNQARKMNLMTYCDGTVTYKKIEARLEEKLKNIGYSEEEINSILSQVSLTAIGTMTDTSNLKATTVTFIDVNDEEISTNLTPAYINRLEEQRSKSAFGTLGRNTIYVYDGTGNHSLKEYFMDDRIVKPAVCSVVSHFLEDSIASTKGEKKAPLAKQNAINQLRVYADETKSPSSLLEILDTTLSYDDTKRYTPSEALIRNELEKAYKELQKTKKDLEREKTTTQKLTTQVDLVIKGVQEHSSETTFYQIMVPAGLWNAPSNRDILQQPSDKTIRQAYESIVLGTEVNQNDSTPIKK